MCIRDSHNIPGAPGGPWGRFFYMLNVRLEGEANEKNMFAWIPMDPHGSPWGRLETHKNPLGTHGDTHGDAWGSMGTHGDSWGPMGTHEVQKLKYYNIIPMARLAKQARAMISGANFTTSFLLFHAFSFCFISFFFFFLTLEITCARSS